MPDIPLSRWADAQLAGMTEIDGAILLGERAMLNGFSIPGATSAGGGCKLYQTRDGHVALNLSRPDDHAALPALFGEEGVGEQDVARLMAIARSADILSQGRALGMAIAEIDEKPASPAIHVTQTSSRKERTSPPLVVDLTALWAGPLAAYLLWLSGATVVKVESANRPDSMREGEPALFALLNQGKSDVALDLRIDEGRDALLTLIRRADVVIEAARPRGLLQLGIDADALVREVPGLVWLTITGHGVSGNAAQWIGFGDDTSVAGGLSAELRRVTGSAGFVGDAIGDPLTGIFAARLALEQLQTGNGARMILSMSAIVAEAIAYEKANSPTAFEADLRNWAAASGRPFPAVTRRQLSGQSSPI